MFAYLIPYLLMTLLGFAGLFLIGLILLQRGRGGGLAGAFGGMGGQSAFGTKAGDVFTRITIGIAAAWILLCAGSVVALHNYSSVPQRAKGFAEPSVKADKESKDVGDSDRQSKPVDADADLKLDLEPDSGLKPDAATPAAVEGDKPAEDVKVPESTEAKPE
jgi:preprotein translocase subunit SecG